MHVKTQCLYKIIAVGWGFDKLDLSLLGWSFSQTRSVTSLSGPHSLDLLFLCTALCYSELNWLCHSYFVCLVIGLVSATLSLSLVPGLPFPGTDGWTREQQAMSVT